MAEKTKHYYDESKIQTLSSLEHIRLRTGADFTHGFCPECNEKHYGVKMPSAPPPAK